MNASELNKSSFFVASVLLAICTVATGQSADVAWTFGNVGFSSYRLDAFEPGDVDFPSLGTQDPTLPLELGQRYQVRVTNYRAHPFEVLAKGNSASQDRVLLSMAVAGPFESDPQVGWADDGQGTVRFTLTAALYEAMLEGGRIPGYRCRPHAATMRGNFTVTGLPIAERIAPSAIRIDLEPVASGLTAGCSSPICSPVGSRSFLSARSGRAWACTSRDSDRTATERYTSWPARPWARTAVPVSFSK